MLNPSLFFKSFVSASVIAALFDLYIVRTLKRYDPKFLDPRFAARNLQWAEQSLTWRALLGVRTVKFMKPRTMMFPAVELMFAVAVVADLAVSGPGIRFYRDVLFLSMCVPLAVISFGDRRECSAPDVLTITGICVGLVFAWFVPVQDRTAAGLFQTLSVHARAQFVSVSESILGAFLPASALWLCGWLFARFRRKEALGFGVVKTVAFIGAFLGTQGALGTIALGAILGAIFGLLYITLNRKDPATYALPFAGILAGASVIMLLYGAVITGWYEKL